MTFGVSNKQSLVYWPSCEQVVHVHVVQYSTSCMHAMNLISTMSFYLKHNTVLVMYSQLCTKTPYKVIITIIVLHRFTYIKIITIP